MQPRSVYYARCIPTPHSRLLTLLTPHSSLLTPHSSLLTPHYSLLKPHYTLPTHYSSLSFLTPHSSLLTTYKGAREVGSARRQGRDYSKAGQENSRAEPDNFETMGRNKKIEGGVGKASRDSRNGRAWRQTSNCCLDEGCYPRVEHGPHQLQNRHRGIIGEAVLTHSRTPHMPPTPSPRPLPSHHTRIRNSTFNPHTGKEDVAKTS